jgi:hypothetical protein
MHAAGFFAAIPPRHDGGALLADGDRGRRIRHPQRRLPIGARRERHRERRATVSPAPETSRTLTG